MRPRGISAFIVERGTPGFLAGQKENKLGVRASEIGVKVCEEAIQIHGGYGYTKEYPVEKYWRDSKICTIGEGTSEVQRLVIARQLLLAWAEQPTAYRSVEEEEDEQHGARV